MAEVCPTCKTAPLRKDASCPHCEGLARHELHLRQRIDAAESGLRNLGKSRPNREQLIEKAYELSADESLPVAKRDEAFALAKKAEHEERERAARAPSQWGLMLKRKRLEAGATQEAFAKSANLSQAEISRLESGAVRGPSADTLDELFRAKVLSLDDLRSAGLF